MYREVGKSKGRVFPELLVLLLNPASASVRRRPIFERSDSPATYGAIRICFDGSSLLTTDVTLDMVTAFCHLYSLRL